MSRTRLYIGAMECGGDIIELRYQVQHETGYIYQLSIDLRHSNELYSLLTHRFYTPVAFEMGSYFVYFTLPLSNIAFATPAINNQRGRRVISIHL